MPAFRSVFDNIDRVTGQMVITGFQGTGLPRDIRKALAEGKLGGVILFKHNIESPEQLRGLTDSIRKAAPDPPAFIAIDQEGGRVSRLGPRFTQFPEARIVGENASTDLVRRLGEVMALELAAAGINLNFAPVLDVDSNPQSPVIGDRSFSGDPARVASLGRAMIEGLAAGCIIACAKHFPGHGDTSTDSHQELPVVDAERSTLESRELVPFREAVAASVPMIMTAHVKYPRLDRYYPATLSEAIITGLLKEKMGFNGVVVTDDLQMEAIAQDTIIEDAAFMAGRAGADLLLICHDPAKAERARCALVKALQFSAIPAARMIDAVERILKIKEERLLRFRPPALDQIKSLIGSRSHQEIVERILTG